MRLRRWLRAKNPAEQGTPSPLRIYLDGGGDMATASPRLQALLWEAETGSHRSDRVRPAERESTHPDTTKPASLTQYLLWLDGYFKRGGLPTHFYDYPLHGFRFASSRLVVDSDYEYGARSRSIIVAPGVTVGQTNPYGGFNGWAHTKLFLMDGYRTNTPGTVPVYSDPEFDTIMTEEHRESRREQEQKSAAFRRGLGGYRPPITGNDDATLAMLSGAKFGPGANLILPSGTRLDGDEAQAWTGVYRNDEQDNR